MIIEVKLYQLIFFMLFCVSIIVVFARCVLAVNNKIDPIRSIIPIPIKASKAIDSQSNMEIDCKRTQTINKIEECG